MFFLDLLNNFQIFNTFIIKLLTFLESWVPIFKKLDRKQVILILKMSYIFVLEILQIGIVNWKFIWFKNCLYIFLWKSNYLKKNKEFNNLEMGKWSKNEPKSREKLYLIEKEKFHWLLFCSPLLYFKIFNYFFWKQFFRNILVPFNAF